MDNSGKLRIVVPGFGLPINHQSEGFRHGAKGDDWDHYTNRWTVREIEMLSFMNAITDKPAWSHKVLDESIVAKWRREVSELPHSILTDVTFDWCIRELRDKAKRFDDVSFVRCFDNEAAVTKSDTLVPEELRVALKHACEPLQARPEEDRDWHPNSNKQVLNLVHPSLYAFVYEKSLVLPQGRIGLKDCLEFYGATKGATATPSIDQEDTYHRDDESLCSQKYQWLPCEVEFSHEAGNDVLIKSYINNLHPVRHEDLYHVIERFISIAIPMWNDCLVHRDENAFRRIDCKGAAYDEDEPDLSALAEERRSRQVIHPEPEDYDEWMEKVQQALTTKIQDDFRDQGLQIIVKLSGIELTPEQPEYQGGSWHLEGMMNERIVATAIYYYDCENITESRLHFQQAAELNELHSPLEYEQGEHGGLEQIFGLEDGALQGGNAVQEIGSAVCKEGRLLCFPNYLQHQVGSFQLMDRTKPGHRRYLVLWLVDPNYRILSSANVPPQQHSWWRDETLTRPSMLSKLPAEILSMVMKESADFPMSLSEAKKNRLELMKERTVFTDHVDGKFSTYNLCEH